MSASMTITTTAERNAIVRSAQPALPVGQRSLDVESSA